MTNDRSKYEEDSAPDLTTIRNENDTGEGGLSKLTRPFRRDKPVITEIVREPEAGGVVYRITKAGKLQIVLFQDIRDRWTIPKGHIEEGETAQESAIREIGEEVGLFGIEPICWLGKVNFRYRRVNSLVIINMQTYLFKAGRDDTPKKEEWMHDVRWFDFDEAVDKIAYEDVAKLVLLARKRLRQKGEIV
jgi:diadenosine hexaphosphate hydrolase (ATP-forming)